MAQKKSSKASAKTRSRKMNVYSNLTHKRKTKKDAAARKRAEYLASLPKHPVKRFFYRLHPKRVAKYWFSKRGALMALKILGVLILLGILTVGALFAYFRKDLDQIRPGELANRVQTTVTKYYDRNNNLLWEDKGSGNYKLVVESDEISQYLKDATVALEDRDYYNHHGVSFSGTFRAFFNNLTGGSVQGGSTLTQQLVKQVFFSDESDDRSLGGVPRKIKEAILAIEVERMYDKEQILTLYLNESPYGGRRNGAESAAQTYFGKSAKDLTLAEATLLAAIPQNPSVFNPYNVAGHELLIARQHTALDYMAQQGYVTREEADKAKEVNIIDSLKPIANQYENIKAPHFVQMVRQELENELGQTTVGQGGLTVKTTLDIRIQNKLEQEMKSFFDGGTPGYYGVTNGAATIEDSKTGQIVALMGSRDFNYPGYGQDNAATAFIQPGSTVKPFVFAELFKDKGSNTMNYGSGTILRDEPINDIYGAELNNSDRRFLGNITIREGLARSRNIPAVKATYIDGVEKTLATIRAAGNKSYCQQEEAAGVGLSLAIGGCGSRQVDLVDAYGTLARQGVYKKHSTILEVKNSSGETISQWRDEDGERVLDPQVTYIVSDILHDPQARANLHGSYAPGLYVEGVETAAKTGTSDIGGKPRDLWIANYSPALSMALWLGNSDTTTLDTANSALGGPVVSNVLAYAHKEVYAKDGKWKPGDWFTKPNGIKQEGKELYPSWWNKNQARSNDKLTFDRVSKKKATSCTPAAAKIELDVTKTTDPVTKRDTFIAPDGYNANEEDDRHKCGDAKPNVSIRFDENTGIPTVTWNRGTFDLSQVTITGGASYSASINRNGMWDNRGRPVSGPITVTVRDQGYYETTVSGTPPSTDSGDDED